MDRHEPESGLAAAQCRIERLTYGFPYAIIAE